MSRGIFFFFFACHFLKQLKFVWDVPKRKFSTGGRRPPAPLWLRHYLEPIYHPLTSQISLPLFADKVIRHNPPLPGLPVVLNHYRTDHNTNQWSTGAYSNNSVNLLLLYDVITLPANSTCHYNQGRGGNDKSSVLGADILNNPWNDYYGRSFNYSRLIQLSPKN